MSTHVVIMAGGVGKRLYPLSTEEHPKQFLDVLGSGQSLIRMTYERFLRVDSSAVFWVVTSRRYETLVKEHLPEVSASHILLEPEPRNTAPCIAYAIWKILSEDSEANVIITPSDAYVPDYTSFSRSARVALDYAASFESIVCVGIKPTAPVTDYGYIKALGRTSIDRVSKVEAFKEKPDLQTAESYLAEGGYFWNAGIFVSNAAFMCSSFRAFCPALSATMDEIAASFAMESEQKALSTLFPQCEKISVDYAVMEKSPSVFVLPVDWEWSDLGSFESIKKITGVDYSTI